GVNGNGQMYGRYQVRFRADEIAGYKTAWMLWPDSNISPRDGEIDFPEADLNTPIIGYLHHQGATAGNDQDYWPTPATYNSWHTATITRMPGYVQFALDGNVIGTSTSRLPNTPMHWILQTETSTYGVTPANSTYGWIQIAWVTAYAPTG
ncbi:MAG: glycoside hydrolase family 16 protein, partial [Actinomycetota bacterium]|nr:glycoside hydrolase family 16 protein [Actinomycetota bacterium]